MQARCFSAAQLFQLFNCIDREDREIRGTREKEIPVAYSVYFAVSLVFLHADLGSAAELPGHRHACRFLPTSVREIITKLPKLTIEERSAVLRRLRELEEKDNLQFLNEATDSMFQEMGKQEAKSV